LHLFLKNSSVFDHQKLSLNQNSNAKNFWILILWIRSRNTKKTRIRMLFTVGILRTLTTSFPTFGIFTFLFPSVCFYFWYFISEFVVNPLQSFLITFSVLSFKYFALCLLRSQWSIPVLNCHHLLLPVFQSDCFVLSFIQYFAIWSGHFCIFFSFTCSSIIFPPPVVF
jgi:hypothetical protein